MGRMDKYFENGETEEKQDESPVLSRVSKNQEIYDDAYLNSKIVDFNTVINVDESEPLPKEETPNINSIEYQEKSYDVNEYLSKAHENKKDDNLKREINDSEFKEQEDEIRRLIASIDEKDEAEDFFVDLKGDNEDTMIGAKFKTDEFDDSIYETLVKEKYIDGNTILEHALGDNTVVNLEKEEDEKIDHTFEKIMKEDVIQRKKNEKLPIIIFSITLFILIVVIVIILLVR